MHIAFITPEFPHPKVLRSAGIGTSIKNLIHGIKAHGGQASKIKCSLFVYGQKEDAVILEEEYTLHLIAHKTYSFGGFIRYRKHLNAYINTIIKKENIDILEAPDWTGITAFMSFDIPLLMRLHGSDTYFCHLENRKQKKKNFFFEKKALKAADAISSVSRFTAQKTKELFALNKDITVIHNAIDVELFKASNSLENTKSILYFGSVIRKKGVLELAKAFNQVITQVPDAQLIILGRDVTDTKTGISTIALIKDILVDVAINNTSFVSQVPYEEVKTYIDKAFLVCLPSRAEAFPMTWLEAMAMEKPLVTSNVGWAPEVMVHKHTGLMVNPNEIDALATPIISF